MNDRLEAQLSALSDGETSELELRGLLKQLDACEAGERETLMRTWSRYHVIGEALADERGDHLAGNDFAAAVALRIADEPLPAHSDVDAKTAELAAPSGANLETAAAVPSWSRFAVAASVALAVVVGVQQYQINSSPANTSQAIAGQIETGAKTSVPVALVSDSLLLASGQNFADDSQATLALSKEQQAQALRAQQRLHEYMLEHANHAARQNGQGITPFARVANFEVEAN